MDVDIKKTVLVVADDVFDGPQCCALKMTSPFLVVNENIVRYTLNIELKSSFASEKKMCQYPTATVSYWHI